MDLVHPDAERYAEAHTSGGHPFVEALRAETAASTSRPQMAGGRVEVKLLEALVVATRARRVLEIGTFTGVSALSMASRLGAGGQLVTIEADAAHAAIARRHIDASPWTDRIELVVGDALTLVHEVEGPFDVVWIDAWKDDYPAYYEAVLPKLAENGIIAADNVLRSGTVLADEPDEPGAVALRRFADDVMADDRVECTLLTVGDGVLLAWRRA